MKKKVLALLLCVGLAAGGLGGCGEPDAPGKETPEAESGEETISGEVHMAYWAIEFDGYLNRCIEEFNKIYPDIKIVLEPAAWDEYWTKLEAASTGGSVADVFWMNGPNVMKYVNGGVMEPIDGYLENSDIDLNRYPEGMVQLYHVNGKQYGIPFTFDTIGVWYNKKLFDAAGVPYPKDDWTWEEMVDTARQLTKEDKSVYGMATQLEAQQCYYNTIFAMGGEVISEDRKSSGFDKAETQAGIQCWVDLQEEEISPSLASLAETAPDVQFLSERVAMLWYGSWFVSAVEASDLVNDVDVVELPSMNGNKGTVIHGVINAISSASENKEAAWKWVEFLGQEKANVICAEEGIIPALEGTPEKWVSAHPQYNLQSFITSAENYSYAYPVSENSAVWERPMIENLKKAYCLEVDVKEACDTIAKEMNEALAKE